MLHGVCEPARLLDLVENFTLFQEVPGGLIKLTAKNHQYLGVNNALEALADIRQREGKLGVFWHTQGSGKSVSMMFFASSGFVTEGHAQAESTRHLRQLLAEDHRYVFTLIHKFRTEPGQAHPV